MTTSKGMTAIGGSTVRCRSVRTLRRSERTRGGISCARAPRLFGRNDALWAADLKSSVGIGSEPSGPSTDLTLQEDIEVTCHESISDIIHTAPTHHFWCGSRRSCGGRPDRPLL